MNQRRFILDSYNDVLLNFTANSISKDFAGNLHIPNIDAISGALFTLRIQYEYTQTQCDDGARDGIDIWLMGIILGELEGC